MATQCARRETDRCAIVIVLWLDGYASCFSRAGPGITWAATMLAHALMHETIKPWNSRTYTLST